MATESVTSPLWPEQAQTALLSTISSRPGNRVSAAWRITFHPFEVEYTAAASGATGTRRAVSVMAVRVDSLGGLFSKLAGRQATVHDPHLRLLILCPPAVLSLPLWFISGWLNLHGLNRLLSFVDVTGFSCRPSSGPAPHFQADGEWLGHIPMQASLIPNAFRLHLPSQEKVRGI